MSVSESISPLTQELKHAGEQLFALEKEREQLQPKLTRASQLQNEVCGHLLQDWYYP